MNFLDSVLAVVVGLWLWDMIATLGFAMGKRARERSMARK